MASTTFAQYSPLFTSGLLCNSWSRLDWNAKPAHTSLPVWIDAATFSISTGSQETPGPAVRLTIQPVLERHSSPCDMGSRLDVPKTISRRASREALTLPSAKPAPSKQALPDVPRERHRPSRLTLTFSTYGIEDAAFYQTSSESPAFSPPLQSSPILSRTERHFSFAASPPPTPPLTGDSDFSVGSPREPIDTTRHYHRSAALASLEGRSPGRKSFVKRPRNFMSMSDDEDEGEMDLDEAEVERHLCGPVEDDFVAPAPQTPSKERTGLGKRRRRSSNNSALMFSASFIDLSS